jgi:hypothetical protein
MSQGKNVNAEGKSSSHIFWGAELNPRVQYVLSKLWERLALPQQVSVFVACLCIGPISVILSLEDVLFFIVLDSRVAT